MMYEVFATAKTLLPRVERAFCAVANPSYIILHTSLLLVLSCTGHPKEVRFEGEFDHLEQGEFLIYSSDEALDRLDTLRLRDGRFEYKLPTIQPATLHILYPNQSELVVFANPGSDIVIKGDAQNLSEVEVSGDEDNEVYTQFRLEANGKSAAEARQIAHNYILEHPTLFMSQYLLTAYFLCDETASAQEVTELYDSLSRACPDDLALSKLSTHVRSLGKLRVGNPLPDFSLKLPPNHGGNGAEERTVKKADYQGKLLLIAFWASWKGGSQSALYRARRLRRELKSKGKSIELLSYSLDADERELYRVERRDTVDYESFCDFRAFASPLVQQWGIRQLPYIILVTPDGRIAAAGTEWMTDIQPTASEL